MELMRADVRTPPTAGVLDWLVDIKQVPDDQAGSRTSIADIVVCPRLVKDAQGEQRQVEDPEQPRMRGELLFLPAGDLSQGADGSPSASRKRGCTICSGSCGMSIRRTSGSCSRSSARNCGKRGCRGASRRPRVNRTIYWSIAARA